MQALRPHVASLGLKASFRGKPLADTAARVVAIAKDGLARRKRLSADGRDETVHLAALEQLVARAECPADGLARGLPSEAAAFRAEVVRRARL
jgi:glutamate--cysteine ligase